MKIDIMVIWRPKFRTLQLPSMRDMDDYNYVELTRLYGCKEYYMFFNTG